METLIRLSTAHARGRLSKSIDVVDAKAAVEMVQFSHFKRVLEKPRKRKRNSQTGEEEETDESDYEEYESEGEKSTGSATRKSAKRSTLEKSDVYDFDEDAPMEVDGPASVKSPPPASKVTIKLTEDRLKQFRQFLFKLFRKEMTQSLHIDQVIGASVKEQADGVDHFTVDEVNSALATMQDNNQIFLSDGLIILV